MGGLWKWDSGAFRAMFDRWMRWLKRPSRPTAVRGFMGRLARDVRGNTLAMGAAALIPLAGMVGGGIDISRMYITKTRMQHACDAGALAGRREMGGGVWSQNSYSPRTAAERFFDANFQSGAYGSQPITRSFAENGGTVTGNASVVLPMTLMRVLGKTVETIAVTCDAEMRLPNTDVMFVLDTTGSMNCVAGDTGCSNNGGVPASGSKIDGLKVAVKCFYEIVARLDTDATCNAGAPSGGTSTDTQIRFGFMPYSVNVNVGFSLPTGYFANTWNYQSRVQNGTDWGDWIYSNYHVRPTSNPNKDVCVAPTANTSTRQWKSEDFKSGSTWYCRDYYRDQVPKWDYKQVNTTVSGLKNGTMWRTSFTLPLNDDGSSRTIDWNGCVEERPTVRQTSYDPIPATAYDLNIDLAPASGNANSLWGFALPDLIYLRKITSSYSEADTANTSTTTNYYNGVNDYCPVAAKKLQEWPSASTFSAYVNSLTAKGNTYHDIGMLWGARFMSPTGIFASENATTPAGGEIARHMIFMTDGDSTSSPCDYNAYGVPWFDQRQTTDVGTAANCGSNRQALIDQINVRLEALCTAVKNKNITLWVISYGGININATTRTRLQNCASPGKYFSADDAAALQTTFKSIADEISQLRLTQ